MGNADTIYTFIRVIYGKVNDPRWVFDFSFTLNGQYHQLIRKRPNNLNEKNISISWSKVRYVRKPSPGQDVIMLCKCLLNKLFRVSEIGIVHVTEKLEKFFKN